MASIEHKTIVDADRHEPKGASTAAVKQALLSNGDGTTFFGFVNYSDIVGKPTIRGYRQIMYAASSASSQNPSAVDTPLQVEFGAAQSLTDISLASTGLITFLTAGQYLLEVSLRVSRTAATGAAILYTRAVYNGAQILASSSTTFNDLAAVVPVTYTVLVDAAVNDTLKLEILRDSAGLNNGGLKQDTPTLPGWNASPSANVTAYKFYGAN